MSGAGGVDFFATGRMKDRTLVFYQMRDGANSVFHIFEPVHRLISDDDLKNMRSNSSTKRFDEAFFRKFDMFYIQGESYAINLFRISIAISTARGIEVMSLDKKISMVVPDRRDPDVQPLADRIRDLTAVGMFRLSEMEFLLVYNEVAVYVNKHGDFSRNTIMEFTGSATQACLVDFTYLVLIDAKNGFVEVRRAEDGSLRQIVTGSDIKLLDDGTNSTDGRVLIRMRHPMHERSQLVLQMIVNADIEE